MITGTLTGTAFNSSKRYSEFKQMGEHEVEECHGYQCECRTDAGHI